MLRGEMTEKSIEWLRIRIAIHFSGLYLALSPLRNHRVEACFNDLICLLLYQLISFIHLKLKSSCEAIFSHLKLMNLASKILFSLSLDVLEESNYRKNKL
jgi:hypothetical protein